MADDTRPVRQHELRVSPLTHEDDYFRRLERERLEAAKARQKERARSRQCPECRDVILVEEIYEGLIVDRCPRCRGVWLEAGELEQLTHHEEHREGAVVRFFREVARTH